LNWVYLDRNTHEVKYGIRVEAESHHVGPWDCTPIDRRLTFEGWEGFVIVQEDEDSDLWALYFDRDDDGLRGEGKVGTQDKRMLLVEVSRKEMRRTKLVSDEERITRIREQADKEKRRAEAELEVATPTEEKPQQSSSSQPAQSAASTSSADTKTEVNENGNENRTGSGVNTHHDNGSSESIDQESSQSSSSYHTACYEISSETQTNTTTW
jgi:hypothetical protein